MSYSKEQGDLRPQIEDILNADPRVDRNWLISCSREFILREYLRLIIRNLPSNGRLFGTAEYLFGDGLETAKPEIQAQRFFSEHKEVMQTKLRGLLESHCLGTKSYKAQVSDQYEDLYIQGLRTTVPWAQQELEDFYQVIGFMLEDFRIGTPFDRNGCRVYENRGYKLSLLRIKNLFLQEYHES